MLILSWRRVSSVCLSLGVSLWGAGALAAEPTAGAAPRRITPAGGLFSIEFPAEPTCEPKGELPDCRYEDAAEGWSLRASYWTAEVSGPPAEFLQKHLAASAEDGGMRIDYQGATHVGESPALDYRLESHDGSEYRAVGRLVLIGTQLVDLEVGGNTLPDEDTTDRFLSAFRVEAPSSGPQPPTRALPAPQPVQAAAPEASPPSDAPSPLAEQLHASPLKPGIFRYQSLWERSTEEGLPASFSVGMTLRMTQHKRDPKRDALVITDTRSTPEGKFEDRYWLDAKTLRPYRWTSESPGASLQLEISDGVVRGEFKGAQATKFEVSVGTTPVFLPGAPLELALSTLPLTKGLRGEVRVLDVEDLLTGKPGSTWRLSVPFAGPVSGFASFKSDVDSYRVELLEQPESGEPRKMRLWIESEKTRRVLQVETLTPASRGGGRSIQMLQSQH